MGHAGTADNGGRAGQRSRPPGPGWPAAALGGSALAGPPLYPPPLLPLGRSCARSEVHAPVCVEVVGTAAARQGHTQPFRDRAPRRHRRRRPPRQGRRPSFSLALGRRWASRPSARLDVTGNVSEPCAARAAGPTPETQPRPPAPPPPVRPSAGRRFLPPRRRRCAGRRPVPALPREGARGTVVGTGVVRARTRGLSVGPGSGRRYTPRRKKATMKKGKANGRSTGAETLGPEGRFWKARQLSELQPGRSPQRKTRVPRVGSAAGRRHGAHGQWGLACPRPLSDPRTNAGSGAGAGHGARGSRRRGRGLGRQPPCPGPDRDPGGSAPCAEAPDPRARPPGR